MFAAVRALLPLIACASAAVPLLAADQPQTASLPAARGKMVRVASQGWDRLLLDDGCLLVNNVWNKAASGGALKQEIFIEELHGKPIAGWRWSSPPRFIPAVVSQPQIVCGDKPWDTPAHLRRDFPFRVGSQRLRANYAANVRASGVNNLAFTMWATRSARNPAKDEISHEIMIWVASGRQRPAGQHRGMVEMNGVRYSVSVREDHRDASGANSNRWTYVAFVAESPVLAGSLDLDGFLEHLTSTGILTNSHFINSVEFGSEIVHGSGIVELATFSLTVSPVH